MSYQISYNKYIKNFLYKDLPYNQYHLKKTTYEYFIIIPIYNELNYICKTLNSINFQKKLLLDNSLIILVINNSKKSSPKIIQNNYKTHKFIKKHQYNFEYVILDYYSTENSLDEKYSGVGTARKIGMDFSLQYSSTSLRPATKQPTAN